VEDLARPVVRVKAFINPDGRTVANLGVEREGSGIVIGSDGLVLTIGYLMVEAHARRGRHQRRPHGAGQLGRLRPRDRLRPAEAPEPLNLRPMGSASRPTSGKGPGAGGELRRHRHGRAVHVVARREFAGSWEYLLDEAIFTTPPHPAWSGAALINREGKLVGVGSLIVRDVGGKGDGEPGNMFVPIDRLPPILADLIAEGRVSGRRGLARRDGRGGRRAAAGGARDGGRPGGEGRRAERRHPRRRCRQTAKGLADFYRKVWARGGAGITVPLDVPARQRRQAHRRGVHEPAGPSETEVDVLRPRAAASPRSDSDGLPVPSLGLAWSGLSRHASLG
jgi:hypothetical protein